MESGYEYAIEEEIPFMVDVDVPVMDCEVSCVRPRAEMRFVDV